MRRAHRFRCEDADPLLGDAVFLADVREAREGLGNFGDDFGGEDEGDGAGRGVVEGVVEGDARALPVDAAQEPRTGRREVGDGEADPIAEVLC